MTTRHELPATEADYQVGDQVYAECFGDGDGHTCLARIEKIHADGVHAELSCPEPSHPNWTVEL